MSQLERLWKDRMDIYRFEEIEVGGITKNVKELKYTNVKCHYSKGSLTDTGEEGVPTLVNSYTLFCGVSTDLREGDEIVVTQRNGRKVTLAAGEIFPYSSHQEASVKRSDTA